MTRRYSVFFPLVLVAAGVLWLLINQHIVPASNLWALSHYWPVLLIGLGIGLIARAYSPVASMVVSALVVIGAFLAVVYAPQLGWNTGAWTDWNFMIGGGERGSGNIQVEARQVGSFDSISVDFPAEITITQGTTQSVSVQADDNLLPQLSTQVRSSELHIETNERDWSKRVNPTKTVKITITVVDLHEVNFNSAGTVRIVNLVTDNFSIAQNGAGEITLMNIVADRLVISMDGAGGIKVDGKASDVTISLDGLGSFDGQPFFAQTAKVSLDGLGSITLHVSESLTATVNGAGSVNYYGSPVVQQSVNGLGSVSKAGD